MDNLMCSFRKSYSIYDKYVILNYVDEVGERAFFDSTGDEIVKRKSSLKIWRNQLSKLIFPLTKSQYYRQVFYTPLEIDDLLALARKNLLRNARDPQDLSNFIQPIFNKKISGLTLKKSEKRELELLNLIDDSGSLTRLGIAQKLSKESCRKQCVELGIPLSKMVLQKTGEQIEIVVMKHLNSLGDIKWFHIENRFYEFFVENIYILVCAELGVNAYNAMTVIKKNLEEEFFRIFTERLFYSHINSIERSGLGFIDRRDPEFSSMSCIEVASVYKAFGYERFLSILKRDFIEPGVYSRGWPDLLGLQSEQLRFVEIKRMDKLTISQIETIPRIIEMDINVEVLIVELK